MRTAPNTVNAYITAAPKEAQAKLRQLRGIIKAAAPKAQEAISYRIPYYSYKGRLIYFAGFKDHVSMYPLTAAAETRVKELKKYRAGKGTARFPLDKPLPVGLIRRFVLARIQENEDKAKE